MYGGLTVQNMGGTPAAAWALNLLQKNVWVERTKFSKDTEMRKYRRFAREEVRGLPPGEIDLDVYVAWLLCEGLVSAKSFRNYLSATRRFCEGEKLLPLPPTPTESKLLTDTLGAARKCEGKFPVKGMKRRAGLSAMNTTQALVWGRREKDWRSQRRSAGWQVEI